MLTATQVINKLKAFTVDEVSTVDAGANLFSELLIAKRADGEDLTATLDEFQAFVAKSGYVDSDSADEAFRAFIVEKMSPTTGELHQDKPLEGQVDRECANCGADVPADAPKCLRCKHKVTKAFPFKTKPKAKKPRLKAKVKAKAKKPRLESSSDVARSRITAEDPEEDDPELELEARTEPTEDEGFEPFGSELDDYDEDVDGEEELDPEAEEDPDNPFGESEGEEEEDPEAVDGEPGLNVAEEFDPSTAQLPGDLPKEVGEYIASLESLIEHQEQEMREQEQMTLAKNATPAKVEDTDLDFLDDIAKSLDDGEDVEYADLTKAFGQMAEVVKGYQARAEGAETVAKAERDIRVTREMTEVVKGWTALALDVNEFPLVLKRAKESLDDETFQAISKAFDAANEAASMHQELDGHSMFSEVGKRGAAENVDNEFEAEIAKRQEAEPGLSRPQAVTKVLNERPELYQA